MAGRYMLDLGSLAAERFWQFVVRNNICNLNGELAERVQTPSKRSLLVNLLASQGLQQAPLVV